MEGFEVVGEGELEGEKVVDDIVEVGGEVADVEEAVDEAAEVEGEEEVEEEEEDEDEVEVEVVARTSPLKVNWMACWFSIDACTQLDEYDMENGYGISAEASY